MRNKNFGDMNAHAIGFIMKEMVRRAIEAIRGQRQAFEVTAKEGHGGQMDDIFTSADKAAQEIYVKMITEAFPGYGIVAEEDHLQIDPDPKIGMYFTVDPLDGTKAFKRRQSHGIGTMIALVRGEEVIAAYVGDVMTREIYGYRPESEKVHRISEYGFGEVLTVNRELPLKEQNALLRERPEYHSKPSWDMVGPPCDGGLFHDFEIATGSIGISTARLWKGEVGAVLLKPKFETPWDCAPVYGICQHLGFVMFEKEPKSSTWSQAKMTVPRETIPKNAEQLFVHGTRVPEMQRWLQRQS